MTAAIGCSAPGQPVRTASCGRIRILAESGPGSGCAPRRDDPLASLVRGTAAGDADALARLYDSTSAAIYGLALRTLTDPADAEEVTLDVFRHVWQKPDSWDAARGSVLAWLLMLARSRCLDRIRNRDARRRAEEPARQRPVSGEMDPVQWERAQRVRTALAQLPREQRELIEMAWFEGVSQSELAGRTGVPLGTVKTRIRLGMARLRNLLGELESY